MGADTKVQWAHDTLNCWLGCDKVSPGCKHCYAEVDTPVRVHRKRGLELWGPKAPRYETKGWQANLRKYVRIAEKTGVLRRIFAQSLADNFEDHPALAEIRARFFAALDALGRPGRRSPWTGKIVDTPGSPVIVLMLTKRPENIARMVPKHWLDEWPDWIWPGCTVEDQEHAALRLPHLLRLPLGRSRAKRFVSAEPLLEEIDLSPYMPAWLCDACGQFMQGRGDAGCAVDEEEASPCCSKCRSLSVRVAGIDWLIVGGESHQNQDKARSFHVDWARSLVAQCRRAEIAPFVKQFGSNVRTSGIIRPGESWPSGTERFESEDVRPGGKTGVNFRVLLKDSHGGNMNEWPIDLRVREVPRLGGAS